PAEELMVPRDISLARLTGARVHLLHLSTAASVAMVEAAKAEGLPISAEAAPHHLCLTDAELAGYDPVFKVNPPLRGPSDVAAVRAGLASGAIDAIATDHAPHPQEAKEAPFDQAPPGMIGLETALAVAVTELADTLPMAAILALLSWRPAKIAGLSAEHGGPVAPGASANLCVIDPTATWELVFNTMRSGYQEVITDPSYAGQVIAFTYPHIGNYGAAPEDDESRRPWCRGVVVRDLASRPSSWRCVENLEGFLDRHGVPGIAGVDTRRLTRHIREAGALPCAF